MNKFKFSFLALVFYSFSGSAAYGSPDALQEIIDICMEKPVKMCQNRIAGHGTDRDTFILAVKFIKQLKKTMDLYESRFGSEETLRFKRILNLKPVIPNVSDYKVKNVSRNERLYVGKKGDRITLSKIGGTWKIDWDKSKAMIGDSSNPAQIRRVRILLGFYHDLQHRLEQKQSLEAIEKANLLAIAGMFYNDLPDDRPEKARFKKLFDQNATTPEEIQKKFLNIADKL